MEEDVLLCIFSWSPLLSNRYQYSVFSLSIKIILCQIRIGHSRLTRVFFMEKDESLRCALRGTYLFVKHVIFNECRNNYEEPRKNVQTSYHLIESLSLHPENKLSFYDMYINC